jgi:hypothetical protein
MVDLMVDRATLAPWLVMVAALQLSGCANILGLDEERQPRSTGAGGSSTSASSGGASSSYVDAVLADGPIAYYRFEEESGALVNLIDSSPAAMPEGQLQYAVPGAVGRALGFDGATARGIVGDSFDFTGLAPMSIEVWVRATSRGSFQHIVQKRAPTSVDGQGYSLSIDNQNLLNFTRVLNGDHRHAKTPMIANTFVHVVGTFDGGTSRLFVDGSEMQSNEQADVAIADTNLELIIGSGDASSFFAGELDELALYDKALSPASIAAHHAAR